MKRSEIIRLSNEVAALREQHEKLKLELESKSLKGIRGILPSDRTKDQNEALRQLESLYHTSAVTADKVRKDFENALVAIRKEIEKTKADLKNQNSKNVVVELEAKLRLLHHQRIALKKQLIEVDELKRISNARWQAFFVPVNTAMGIYYLVTGAWGVIEDAVKFAGEVLTDTIKMLPILKSVMGVVVSSLGWVQSWFPEKWHLANKLRLVNSTIGAMASYVSLALTFNPITFPLGMAIFAASTLIDFVIDSYLLNVAINKKDQAVEEFGRAKETHDKFFLEEFEKQLKEELKAQYKGNPQAHQAAFKAFVKDKEAAILENPSNPALKPFRDQYENYLTAKAKLEKAQTHVSNKSWGVVNSFGGSWAMAAGVALLFVGATTPLGWALTAFAFTLAAGLVIANITKKILDTRQEKAEKKPLTAQDKLDNVYKAEASLSERPDVNLKQHKGAEIGRVGPEFKGSSTGNIVRAGVATPGSLAVPLTLPEDSSLESASILPADSSSTPSIPPALPENISTPSAVSPSDAKRAAVSQGPLFSKGG